MTRIHRKTIQKRSNEPGKHDGVFTYQQSDILDCKVKWALGSITMNKASGGDGIPVELFQILKDDAVKVLHSICQKLENSAMATGLQKVNFHSSPKERQCQRMFKLPHNYTHLTHQQSSAENSPSQDSTLWTKNFQMFMLNLEMAEEPEIKLATSIGS